jgi:serine protease Do
MYPINRLRWAAIALFVLLSVGLLAHAQSHKQTKASRAYLGILMAPAGEEGKGVLVREVTPDSPAAKACLKKGDRVVKVNVGEVRDIKNFSRDIASHKPGDKLRIGILRDGKEQTLTVTLGERTAWEVPAFPEFRDQARPAFFGVQAEPMTPELKKKLNADVDAGAVVTEVMPSSPAAKAGLKQDDVITAINGKPVKSPEELHAAIEKAGAGKSVKLRVVHGKEERLVKATLQDGSFSFFQLPGEDRFPNMEPMISQNRRIRELERRVNELEKRLLQLEKK